MRVKGVDYTKYVHEFVDAHGATRYAVAELVDGQYQCPVSESVYKRHGVSRECASTTAGLGGYLTKREALRRARYLFGRYNNYVPLSIRRQAGSFRVEQKTT